MIMSKLPPIFPSKGSEKPKSSFSTTTSSENFLQKIEDEQMSCDQIIDQIFLKPELALAHDRTRSNLLHWAIFRNYFELLEFICGKKVGDKQLSSENLPDINAVNNYGKTALNFAVHLNADFRIINLLFEKGADADIADHKGCVPLHRAIENSRIDLIGLICVKTKNIEVRDISGRSPIDIARKAGNNEIIDFLDSFKKNPESLLLGPQKKSAKKTVTFSPIEEGDQPSNISHTRGGALNAIRSLKTNTGEQSKL